MIDTRARELGCVTLGSVTLGSVIMGCVTLGCVTLGCVASRCVGVVHQVQVAHLVSLRRPGYSFNVNTVVEFRDESRAMTMHLLAAASVSAAGRLTLFAY